MPHPRSTAVDGPRGVVLRQRRLRGVFLHPRTRGLVPAPLRHEGTGPRGHPRLVLRLLQPPTPAQLGRVATTRRLRENRDHPTGGRIKEAFAFSGETHSESTREPPMVCPRSRASTPRSAPLSCSKASGQTEGLC